MDKIAKKTLKKRLTIPCIVALIGVLAIAVGLFLPYICAVGEMAEYIAQYPDSLEIAELDMTASDLKEMSMVSVSKIASFTYSESEGALFNGITVAFCVLLAVCLLFVILKKPIPVMIFSVLTYGAFAFHNFATKMDFFRGGNYAWGIGYYMITVASVVVFACSVWMLVKKIKAKKELADQPEE